MQNTETCPKRPQIRHIQEGIRERGGGFEGETEEDWGQLRLKVVKWRKSEASEAVERTRPLGSKYLRRPWIRSKKAKSGVYLKQKKRTKTAVRTLHLFGRGNKRCDSESGAKAMGI